MDKIYIENLCSMFPNIDKEVINLLYNEDKNNIVDSLLEISNSCKKNKSNKDDKDDNHNDEGEDIDNETNDNLRSNNHLFDFFNFNKKNDGYEYQQL